MQILYALHVRGPLTQKQICEMGEIPKQTINKGIAILKQDKLITLRESETDKREKIIVRTKQGEEYSQELLAPLFELEEKVVLRMGVDLFEQLFTALMAYGDALELEMELAGKNGVGDWVLERRKPTSRPSNP